MVINYDMFIQASPKDSNGMFYFYVGNSLNVQVSDSIWTFRIDFILGHQIIDFALKNIKRGRFCRLQIKARSKNINFFCSRWNWHSFD
jgi:hypothetical protein